VSAVARWQVPLLGVMAGTAMADANIASTALVDAARGLDMNPSQLPIAASAMSMCLAASVVSTGLLADRRGRRRVLMVALALGILAELVIAAATGPVMFIAGRGMVGIAMGIVFSAAFATVRVVTSPVRLGAALGVFGAVAGLSMLVESFVGGSLATVDWRLAFTVVPLVLAVSLVLVPRMLPVQARIGSGPVDVSGQLLLIVAVVGPLYALGQLSSSLSDLTTWLPMVLGVAAFVAFCLLESRRAHAFFPVRIFRERLFLAGVLFGVGFNVSNAVLVLQLANVWQYAMRLDTVEVAAAQAPGLAIGIAASIVAGRRLSAGVSERTVGAVGFLLVVMGFATLVVYRAGASFWMFVPALLLVGAGAPVLNVPFGSLVMKSAHDGYYGPVTASRTTIGQFAYALGMAGATVVIDRLTEGGVVARLQDAGAPPVDVGRALDAITVYVRTGANPATAAGQHALAVAATSYAQAFAVTMGVVAAVLAVMGLAAWRILRTRPSA
jgi:MFS family permease